MADFNARSDSVNVESVMEQIRARIREKRGVEYSEADIQALAAARIEKLLDPHNARSDLLEEFRRVRSAVDASEPKEDVADDTMLFQNESGSLPFVRALLRPLVRLALNTKALAAAVLRAKPEPSRLTRDRLTVELLHDVVVETTRLTLEVKNLTMRVESLQSRLEFNERRARALESAIVHDATPDAPTSSQPRASHDGRSVEFRPRHDQPPAQAATQPATEGVQGGGAPDGSGQRRRRRRRRGRRGGGFAQPGSQPTNVDAGGSSAQQASAPAFESPSSPEPHDAEIHAAEETGSDSDSDPDPQ